MMGTPLARGSLPLSGKYYPLFVNLSKCDFFQMWRRRFQQGATVEVEVKESSLSISEQYNDIWAYKEMTMSAVKWKKDRQK